MNEAWHLIYHHVLGPWDNSLRPRNESGDNTLSPALCGGLLQIAMNQIVTNRALKSSILSFALHLINGVFFKGRSFIINYKQTPERVRGFKD